MRFRAAFPCSDAARSPSPSPPPFCRETCSLSKNSISFSAGTTRSAKNSPPAPTVRPLSRFRANARRSMRLSKRSAPGARRRRKSGISPRCLPTPRSTPRCVRWRKRRRPTRARGSRMRRRRSNWRCSPRTKPTRRASFSKCAREPAATRRRSLLAISSAPIRNTPRSGAGASNSFRKAPARLAVSRKSSPRFWGAAFMEG